MSASHFAVSDPCFIFIPGSGKVPVKGDIVGNADIIGSAEKWYIVRTTVGSVTSWHVRPCYLIYLGPVPYADATDVLNATGRRFSVYGREEPRAQEEPVTLYQPSVGDIVLYHEGDRDCPYWNKDPSLWAGTNGQRVHPAIVTRLLGDGFLSLMVMFDGACPVVRRNIPLRVEGERTLSGWTRKV